MKFLLEGTPGTGKSGFGLYCVIRFVRDGRLVWYRYKEHAPMIFVGSDNAKELFERHIPDVVVSSGAVSPLDSSYSSKLEAIPNLVRIYDPEPGATILAEGQLFDVIVSSPDAVKLNGVRKSQTTSIRYLPLWSLDELEHIREYHAFQNGKPWLKAQFETFGGTPRIIFDREGDIKLKTAIRLAKADDLRGFFDKPQKGGLLPHLIHMQPNEDYTMFEYKIASDKIGELLVQEFTQNLQTDLTWWLAACRDDPDMAITCGKLKEHQWHRGIAHGGDFVITPLGTHRKPSTGSAKPLTLPPLGISNVVSLDDIQTLRPLAYYRPTISNFKTFDSFAILPKLAFTTDTKDSQALVIVGFQMTASKKHPLLKSGIEELETKIRSSGLDCAEFYIVFVQSHILVFKHRKRCSMTMKITTQKGPV